MATFTDALAAVDLAQVALWLGLAGAVLTGVRRTWPILTRLKDVLDDIQGEPARPGVPARPGIFERLRSAESLLGTLAEALDGRLDALEDRLESIEVRLTALEDDPTTAPAPAGRP